MTPTRTDDGTDSLEYWVEDLHANLEATGELPIDPRTNRWLGEAAAVAEDAATSDLDEATIEKRVRQVDRLLEEVEGTGHEAADEHVAQARAACRSILDDTE